MDIYLENGYKNREDYLLSLAIEYDLDIEDTVRPIADLLGPSEDFDGLVAMLNDLAI
jgi:hypothetical protein